MRCCSTRAWPAHASRCCGGWRAAAEGLCRRDHARQLAVPVKMGPMPSSRNIHDQRLADAWATLKAHSDAGLPLDQDASRLAFADPEFLLRRETRGIRFQLELLKPDLEQQAHRIENTIVVVGGARLRDSESSAGLVQAAEASGEEAVIRRARALARNAPYYEKARAFGRI